MISSLCCSSMMPQFSRQCVHRGGPRTGEGLIGTGAVLTSSLSAPACHHLISADSTSRKNRPLTEPIISSVITEPRSTFWPPLFFDHPGHDMGRQRSAAVHIVDASVSLPAPTASPENLPSRRPWRGRRLHSCQPQAHTLVCAMCVFNTWATCAWTLLLGNCLNTHIRRGESLSLFLIGFWVTLVTL